MTTSLYASLDTNPDRHLVLGLIADAASIALPKRSMRAPSFSITTAMPIIINNAAAVSNSLALLAAMRRKAGRRTVRLATINKVNKPSTLAK